MNKKFLNCHKDRDFIILGSAHTTKIYQNDIATFIEKSNLVTIGMNNMTHMFVPNYHLWTNNQRLKDFHQCIKPESQLLLGSHIKDYTLEETGVKNFDVIKYTDQKDEKIEYKDEIIYGFFRISGNLAIYIAHLMGARNIYVVGFDGYSKPIDGNQHCYGTGLTDFQPHYKKKNVYKDTATFMAYEKEKDNIIYGVLRNIQCNIHQKLWIITPTLYESLYNPNILGIGKCQKN